MAKLRVRGKRDMLFLSCRTLLVVKGEEEEKETERDREREKETCHPLAQLPNALHEVRLKLEFFWFVPMHRLRLGDK